MTTGATHTLIDHAQCIAMHIMLCPCRCASFTVNGDESGNALILKSIGTNESTNAPVMNDNNVSTNTLVTHGAIVIHDRSSLHDASIITQHMIDNVTNNTTARILSFFVIAMKFSIRLLSDTCITDLANAYITIIIHNTVRTKHVLCISSEYVDTMKNMYTNASDMYLHDMTNGNVNSNV